MTIDELIELASQAHEDLGGDTESASPASPAGPSGLDSRDPRGAGHTGQLFSPVTGRRAGHPRRLSELGEVDYVEADG
jgi:hypothetical protein